MGSPPPSKDRFISTGRPSPASVFRASGPESFHSLKFKYNAAETVGAEKFYALAHQELPAEDGSGSPDRRITPRHQIYFGNPVHRLRIETVQTDWSETLAETRIDIVSEHYGRPAVLAHRLGGGMLVTNPIPEEYSMDHEVINKAIDEAVAEANRLGIHGKETTPFLLAKIKDLTGGDSLASNIQLVYNNAKLAAATACELSKLAKN